MTAATAEPQANPAHTSAPDLQPPAWFLVDQIRENQIDPRSLPPAQRQSCVEHLLAEGLTNDQIASHLLVHQRTIRRDRQALARAQALRPTLCLSDELLGQYHLLADESIQRLRRITRDPNAPIYARLTAEQAITKTLGGFMHTFRLMEQMEKDLGPMGRTARRQKEMQELATASTEPQA